MEGGSAPAARPGGPPAAFLLLGAVVVPAGVSADGLWIWQLVRRVGVGWRPPLPARDSSLAVQRAAAARWRSSVAGAAAPDLVVAASARGRCVPGRGGSRDLATSWSQTAVLSALRGLVGGGLWPAGSGSWW